MEDYKLKVVLAVLSAVVFSMIFIILALVVPVKEDTATFVKKEKAKNRLEEISRSIQGN
ncbi:MAG: hypothetical protein R3302_07970 [Sulfurimonadaceae bacterium]|nr:hypothetical protein [Sulfurimonadaceae bacterium]